MKKKKEINCSWKEECMNFPDECYHCKWNSNVDIDNYLEFKEGKKEVRYLEVSDNG